MEHKLKTQKGETIVEILLSLLVVALSVSFMVNAIATAASVNKNSQDVTTGFLYESDTSDANDQKVVKKFDGQSFKLVYPGCTGEGDTIQADVYAYDPYKRSNPPEEIQTNGTSYYYAGTHYETNGS